MTFIEQAPTIRRIPRLLVAGVLVVAGLLSAIAAIAALGYQLLAASSSPVATSIKVLRIEHRGAADEYRLTAYLAVAAPGERP